MERPIKVGDYVRITEACQRWAGPPYSPFPALRPIGLIVEELPKGNYIVAWTETYKQRLSCNELERVTLERLVYETNFKYAWPSRHGDDRDYPPFWHVPKGAE